MKDRPTEDLHTSIVRVVLCEVLCELQGDVGLARNLLGQRLRGSEVGGILFAGDSGQDFVGLTQSDLGAELQHACGKLVLGGESGGLEVDHVLVLARVEGIVDVEELWGMDQRAERGAWGTFKAYHPRLRKDPCCRL